MSAAPIRMTEKRRNFLAVLGAAEAPLSAYEVMDAYQAQFGARILAPSAYRILNSLVAAGLVHRLETCNKYLLCTHEADHESERPPQFLICDSCNTVRELHVPPRVQNALIDSGRAHGFSVERPQIELHGVCERCQ